MKFKNPFRGSKKGKEDDASGPLEEEKSPAAEKEEAKPKSPTTKADAKPKAEAKPKTTPTKKKEPAAAGKKEQPKKSPPPKKDGGAVVKKKDPPKKAKAATTSKAEKNVVDLPENYVAFVLPSDANGEPSSADIEAWRKGTVDYISAKLKAQDKTFSQLKLDVLETEFGHGKPASRFHLFLKVKAEVHYTKAGKEVPHVFERYISSFQEEYLEKGLRPLKNCSLKYAKEVRARRMGSGAPGAVTAPQFYIALVCQDPKEPTPQQIKALEEVAKAEFSDQLTKEFEDAFDQFTTLEVVKTELSAGKPEPQYNVYLEMEANATFKRDVPEPMDFFRPMSRPSMDFGKNIKAKAFNDCSLTVVRCIYVESPPEADLPPDDGDEDADGEPAEGEGGGEEGDEKDGSRPTVKMELGFYVALVLDGLKDSPSNHTVLDDMLTDFFTKTLDKSFPNLANLHIECTPQYEAGIPLPRFNLLHPYTATIEWYDEPPEGDEALKKILFCDLQALYQKIQQLPAPYSQMLEFTLGRALEQQVTDQAYGGTLDDEQKRIQEAARREAEDKKRREEEAARKLAEEQKAAAEKKAKEEAARKAAAEKKAKEEAAKKAAAEKKAKEEAAKKAAAEKKAKEEAAAAEKKRKEEAAKKAAAEKKAREEAAAAEKKAKEEAAKKAAAEKKAKEEAAAAEKKRKEEAAKKAAAEKKAKEEAAAAEKKRKEEAAKKAAAEKKAKEEAAAAEKKRKEEAAKKAAAEKKAKEEAAAAEKKRKEEAAAAEKNRKEEAAKKAAAEKKAKEEQAAKKAAADKRKKEAAQNSSKGNTGKPKAPASKRASTINIDVPEGDTIPVGTADVYVALFIPNCPREPTEVEYDALAATTQDFYAKHLKKAFKSFARIKVAVSDTRYGDSMPDKLKSKYNVYIEWDINAKFVETGPDAPDRFRLCNSLVEIDLNDYVKNHVWSVKGSPFPGSRAFYTQQVNTWKSG